MRNHYIGFFFIKNMKAGMEMTDKEYMNMAIALAKKGEGWTNPNPMVGAVIVKDDRVIGQGYHAYYGGYHAERNAFQSLHESAKGATLYVTLEPCCHYGKTPPCTEIILENQIARVVVGSRDPNRMVAGKGIALLRKAGILVEEDFMREICDQINPIFFHYITKKTPYVVMKYGMTLDGKIATKEGASKWITGKLSREEVQRLRATYMGVMVGIGTVLMDDPMLNVRMKGLRNPVRIICDSNLKIPISSKICQTAKRYKTIIAYAYGDAEKEQQLEALGIRLLKVESQNGHIDLRKLMKLLGEMGIDSILLEGGGTLNDSALKSGIIHEIKVFIAPKIFGGIESKSPVEGSGIVDPSEAIKLEFESIKRIEEDIMISYKVRREGKCSQEL